jgi:hypothetical protein
MFISTEAGMFKTLVSLFRGAAAAAEKEVTDHGALLIPDRQIRDAAGVIKRGQRALAIADHYLLRSAPTSATRHF